MRYIRGKLSYIILGIIIIIGLIISIVILNNRDVNDMSISFNVSGNMQNLGCLSIYVDEVGTGYEYSFDNGRTWQSSNYGAIYQNGKTTIYVRDNMERIIFKKEININSFDNDAPIIKTDFDMKISKNSEANLLKGVSATLNGNGILDKVKTTIIEENDNEILVSYFVQNDDKKCYLIRNMKIDSSIKDEQIIIKPLSSTKWTWPTNSNYSITRGYGSGHSGIDIYGTGRSSPIYAARGGEVVDITSNSSSGYYIILKHDNGYYTRYAHLQNTDGNDKLGKTSSATKYISIGQTVKAHDIIGEIGCSGTCTGAHLHFEIWEGEPFKGKSYNPLKFFK